MKIALCQIDPTVGDFVGNRARIVGAAKRAAAEGAQIAFFSELVLVGYPPRDLLDRASFVDAALTARDALVSELPKEITCVFGFVDRAVAGSSRKLHNAVGVARDGKLVAVAHKRLLPTYDVFDDDRYFEPGSGTTVFEVDGVRFGVTICEDIWNDVPTSYGRRYSKNPVDDVLDAKADVIVNIAASPFTLTKRTSRASMLAEVARLHQRPVVFVNQVGGFDDLLFDGSSALWNREGALVARAHTFAEDVLVCELETGGEIRARAESDEGAAIDALILGTRDYAQKCGFRSAVLGLSGGIDSALVACIAKEALGEKNVLGVALPTRYSSDHSRNDARDLARNLGIEFREIPIDSMFQSYLDALTPELASFGAAPSNDVTFENIQSRIRCAVLMALSNRCGHLLLTTGNKSELAVGYCTLYGDMAGGLAVLSDLPKTFVYRVSHEINRRAGREIIPSSTLTKPPSAELRPDQTDQDSLPPYDVLDAILARYIEDERSSDEIIAEGFDEATVRRVVGLVVGSEYKRQQIPPGLIVTKKAFGQGRRYPLAQKWRA